jgi:RNA polymerase sigma-70 factor (ECF subfamily)
MSGYQRASEQATTALIEKVSPLLLRYFLVSAGNRRFAEDLVQDTWIRIHLARHTYRPHEPVLPWIFAIARHTGLDHYRKARRIDLREAQVEVLPDQPAPVKQDAAQEAAALEGLLAELPQSQREVLLMLKVMGMSIEEVALATASTSGSVKQKAHRAYQKLRELLIPGTRNNSTTKGGGTNEA